MRKFSRARLRRDFTAPTSTPQMAAICSRAMSSYSNSTNASRCSEGSERIAAPTSAATSLLSASTGCATAPRLESPSSDSPAALRAPSVQCQVSGDAKQVSSGRASPGVEPLRMRQQLNKTLLSQVLRRGGGSGEPKCETMHRILVGVEGVLEFAAGHPLQGITGGGQKNSLTAGSFRVPFHVGPGDWMCWRNHASNSPKRIRPSS